MKQKSICFWIYLLASIAWFCLILFASGASSDTQNKMGLLAFVKEYVPNYDKVIHTGLYGVYGFLLFGLFSNYPLLKRAWLWAFTVAFVTGLVMEFLQYTVFVGRSADGYDVFANTLGAVFGLLLFGLMQRKTKLARC